VYIIKAYTLEGEILVYNQGLHFRRRSWYIIKDYYLEGEIGLDYIPGSPSKV
jgi:hypothetical protein